MVADAPAQPALDYDGRWSRAGGAWGFWPLLLAAKGAAARMISAEKSVHK